MDATGRWFIMVMMIPLQLDTQVNLITSFVNMDGNLNYGER
jgi:hypothetical protein